MDAYDFKLIKSLVDIPGLSGRESLIHAEIESHLPREKWEIFTDPLGNLTARKGGKGKKILILTHMDEVGLIVRRITNKGFLKVERLGGISYRALYGNVLDLWTNAGRIDAHVGLPAAHIDKNDCYDNQIENLFIDVGVNSRKEAEALGIRVGDGLTWKSDFIRFGNNNIRGKALDNRLGCFILIKLARIFDHIDLEYDITLGFVTQEESMILEAAPIVRRIDPDIVIGVDGTLPFDTPDIDEPQSDIVLGEGFCVKIMDAIRGKIAYLPCWDLTTKIMNYFEKERIPFQPEVVIGLSSAISLVPFMNHGIKTIGLSIPVRYHHSPVEVANLDDVYGLIAGIENLLLRKVFD